MDNFINKLKYEKITLEDSFNYSFDILKTNINKFILPIILLCCLNTVAAVLRIFATESNSSFLLLYTMIISFISSIIYAGLRIELTSFIENEKQINNPVTSGKKVIGKILLIVLIYLLISIFIGIVAGGFMVFITLIASASREIAIFLAVLAIIIFLALIFYIVIKLAFFQNVYYVRNLDLISSLKYSLHIIKGYFMKIFMTKLIFIFFIIILYLPIVFGNFLAVGSKDIFLIIIGLIIQSIFYLVMSVFIFLSVFVISLFYLNAEYLDLKK